ncbi:MAG: DUF4381 domain-containing protein [Mariprofundales bacterium]
MELRDIHMPEAISWWPLAIGWWIVLVMVLLLCAGLWWWLQRSKIRRQIIKQARTELKKMQIQYNDHGDASKLVCDCSVWFRRVSISLFPQQKHAGLVGKNWLLWLESTLKDHRFTDGVGVLLISAPYAKQSTKTTIMNDDQANQLLQLSQHWLTAIEKQAQKHQQK